MSFQDRTVRESYKQYFFLTVKIKDYNVIIDGGNLFDQSVKNDWRTYDNIRKIVIGQGDDYTTRSLLDYPYFKKYYKVPTIDLSKQQKLDVDPKSIQQINSTGNLDRAGNTQMFSIFEKVKGKVLDFSKETVKVLWFCFKTVLI